MKQVNLAYLTAIALTGVLTNEELTSLLSRKDFRDQDKPIEIKYLYDLDEGEIELLKKEAVKLKLERSLRNY